MGNFFPQVLSLKDKPSCLAQTVKLIEKSFQYKAPNSFLTDFAPLMDESNHHNCFILIDENENVLAHVGVKERKLKINNSVFNICMLGGIAVEEEHRGQGYFQQLFQDVLAEKRSDTCFFLLWSDQEKLYKKYGFSFCGGQYELAQTTGESTLTKSSFSDKKQFVMDLYKSSFQSTYLSLERSEADWQQLSKITSSELFVNKNGYLFRGKGQDLEGVIHEYGCKGDITTFLNEARKLGKVWMGTPLIDTDQAHYQFMLCPGDLKLLCDFVSAFTNGAFKLLNINVMKQEVFFEFNQETLMLVTEEFVTGIFGPGPFEELGDIRPLFISGLDSI